MSALLLMTALGFTGYAALLPVAPFWATTGGADAAGAGFVTGVFMLFTVLGQLCVPWALHRFGMSSVLVTGLLLLGVPSLGYFVSADLAPVLFFSAIRGLGFAILTVTASSAIAELVEPERRGTAIGAFGLAIAAPQLLVMPIAPWLAETFGFGLVFVIGAVSALGAIPAVRLAHHVRTAAHAAPPITPAPTGRRAAVWHLLRPMALLLAVTLAGGALITFAPQLVESPLEGLMGLLLLTATAALVRWAVGPLADRHGIRPFLWPLVTLNAAGLLLVAWAVAPTDGVHAGLFLTGMAVVGIGYGGLQNLTLGMSFLAVHRRDTVFASALWNVGFDLGTGIGAVVVGSVAAGSSFTFAFTIAAIVAIATLPLAVRRAYLADPGAPIASAPSTQPFSVPVDTGAIAAPDAPDAPDAR